MTCRCETEERAAILWADGLISEAYAHRMADSGEICVGCKGLYESKPTQTQPTPQNTR